MTIMLKSVVKTDTQGVASVNCHHFETNLTTYHNSLKSRCTLGLSMVGCPFETYHRTYHLASDLPSQSAWIERDVQRRLGSIKQKIL